jgi:gamma-glutamylcyclotransferase (GGCT)/AIG2-like uncharacterized protein YtfP
MDENVRLYFAYGSNMSQKRIEERVGQVTKFATHKLKGFKLNFNTGFQSAFANLEMTGIATDFVEGVVYVLSPGQLKVLDHYEGYPECYQKVIHSFYGYDLYIYISINKRYDSNNKIHPLYMQHLITGCEENNFVHTLEFLKTIPLIPKKKIKFPKGHKKRVKTENVEIV